MTSKKCDFAPAQRAEHIGIGRRTKRCIQPHFMHIGQTRHGVQTTPADYSNFRLQRIHLEDGVQLLIIQNETMRFLKRVGFEIEVRDR